MSHIKAEPETAYGSVHGSDLLQLSLQLQGRTFGAPSQTAGTVNREKLGAPTGER